MGQGWTQVGEDGPGADYRNRARSLMVEAATCMDTDRAAAEFLIRLSQVASNLAISSSVDQLRVAFLTKGL